MFYYTAPVITSFIHPQIHEDPMTIEGNHKASFSKFVEWERNVNLKLTLSCIQSIWKAGQKWWKWLVDSLIFPETMLNENVFII